MKILGKAFLIAIAFLTVFSCTKKSQNTVSISSGLLQGVPGELEGVTVFKGIPYAAAPVGELRWQLPQNVTPWKGVRLADHFSSICPQADLSQMDLYGKEFYSDGMPEMSEDCLYLNVWAPTESLGDKDAKVPVALWIHGGAYDHGWGFEGAMNGDDWAAREVILVTINYRVGIFGFFAHPELTSSEGGLSCNFGIRDQIKALEWTYENIAAFGGDPDNITILGQSAGARSVQYLCASDLSKDYVSHAIIQSGNGISPDTMAQAALADAEAQGAALMEFGGYESLDAMRAASSEELLKLVDDYKAAGNRVSLRPCTDDFAIKASFSGAAYGNMLKDMPYMIGSVTGDGVAALGNIDNFCNLRDSLSSQPVYEYEFVRELPGDDRGAFHSAELWYMFGTIDRCWRPMTAGDDGLCARMMEAWTNFAKYGDPDPSGYLEWPAYTRENKHRHIFDI